MGIKERRQARKERRKERRERRKERRGDPEFRKRRRARLRKAFARIFDLAGELVPVPGLDMALGAVGDVLEKDPAEDRAAKLKRALHVILEAIPDDELDDDVLDEIDEIFENADDAIEGELEEGGQDGG
mgnify:CR=1 FL=1